MDWKNEILLFFTNEGMNRRMVLIGSILLGCASGIIGTFALLRRQSLLGDAMAHAALPGVCLMFLITGLKDPFLFLIGACISGFTGALCVIGITRYSRLKNDTAIGLVLSVFFGVGIVLLTYIQQSGAGNQAGLNTFLFGKAASLLQEDVRVMVTMCGLIIFFIVLFYKEFKILSFDPNFGASLGFSIKFLDVFLTSLVVLTVMVGLQAVGVVLMVAMIIIPPAAARQWTEKLERMIIISAFIGALSGALGAILSTLIIKMPTGPVMVLVAAFFLGLSLFFAPNRGLLFSWYRRWSQKRKTRIENILKAIYKVGENSQNYERFIPLNEIKGYFSAPLWLLRLRLRILHLTALVEYHPQEVRLTSVGFEQAKNTVRKHRLWEAYLSNAMDIPHDHVHRDAEEVEHIFSPELTSRLEEYLDSPEHDPHGKSIPNVNGNNCNS